MRYLRWRYTGFVTVTTEPSAITVSFPSFPVPEYMASHMTLHCPEEPVVLHFHFAAMNAQSAAFLSRNDDQWKVIEPEFVRRRLSDKKASIVSLCFHILLLAAERAIVLFHSLFLLSNNPHVHTYTHPRSPLVNRLL